MKVQHATYVPTGLKHTFNVEEMKKNRFTGELSVGGSVPLCGMRKHLGFLGEWNSSRKKDPVCPKCEAASKR